MCVLAAKSVSDTCINMTSTGAVIQVFRYVTTEWLEIVCTDPTTDAVEQIISTPGHRFLKPDGSYGRIVDMADRSGVVADAASDNRGAAKDNSFGCGHPFSAGAEGPFGPMSRSSVMRCGVMATCSMIGA